MKKAHLVGALVILGGVGYLVLGSTALASPQKKACVHLADVCSVTGDFKDLDKCVESFDKLEKMAGKEPTARSLRCIEESQTCTAAAGCMVGGAGMGVLGEFMKGVGSSMTR